MMNNMDSEMFPNTYCIDCFNPRVEFCSINNAVFLCEACAKVHFKLGKDISYLKRLTMQIGQNLAIYIQRGGNDRFYKLMKKYNLQSLPIEKKYVTYVSEYYRRLLKSEVECDEPPEEISYFDSMRICQSNEINHCTIDDVIYDNSDTKFFNSLFTISNNEDENKNENLNENIILQPSLFSSSVYLPKGNLPLPPE